MEDLGDRVDRGQRTRCSAPRHRLYVEETKCSQNIDRIVLKGGPSGGRLKGGDVGTIVHVHRDGEAFEVEFLALDGNTAAVATVPASRLRPVTATDLTHVRVSKKVGSLRRSTTDQLRRAPRRRV